MSRSQDSNFVIRGRASRDTVRGIFNRMTRFPGHVHKTRVFILCSLVHPSSGSAASNSIRTTGQGTDGVGLVWLESVGKAEDSN